MSDAEYNLGMLTAAWAAIESEARVVCNALANRQELEMTLAPLKRAIQRLDSTVLDTQKRVASTSTAEHGK